MRAYAVEKYLLTKSFNATILDFVANLYPPGNFWLRYCCMVTFDHG